MDLHVGSLLHVHVRVPSSIPTMCGAPAPQGLSTALPCLNHVDLLAKVNHEWYPYFKRQQLVIGAQSYSTNPEASMSSLPRDQEEKGWYKKGRKDLAPMFRA